MHAARFPLLLLLVSLTACGSPSGVPNSTTAPGNNNTKAVPAISGLTYSSDATTIVVGYQVQAAATSSLACGTTPRSYTIEAVDNGLLSAASQQNVVAGLAPSTRYDCQITATTSTGSATATFSLATTAVDATTPISSVSFGPISSYNSIDPADQGSADTFYNCKSNDGVTYFTVGDMKKPWQQNGTPVNTLPSSTMSIAKFTSESPLAGITTNFMQNYGQCCSGTGDDSRSQKDSGLFCMAGNIYIALGRQLQGNHTVLEQNAGQIAWSPDKGQSWNNFQTPTVFNAMGNPTTPPSASMFAASPSAFGAATFVMYGADDGTLGYTAAINRHDNANAYIYLIANEGAWNGGGPSNGGGNAYYLARVPRAKISRLQPDDYQYYVGGDGSLDAGWTSTQANAQPILSNYGELGTANVQYVPALNRYLLLTFFYPHGAGNPSTTFDTTWLIYEAPHPWGPWSLVNTTHWPTQGYYNPVILNDTIEHGTTPTLLFTGDFFDGGSASYQMYLSTMTIN
jgi:hypothetical protein